MVPIWILLAAVAWLGLIALSRWVIVNPRGGEGGVDAGLLLLFIRVYAKLVHRVRYDGLAYVRAVEDERPLIVVCNHTAGVDPILVQNATRRFEPRWMMASDMRVSVLEPFWRYTQIIDVARFQGDPGSARAALKHLKSGGVLGIFPEGGIERPARMLLPFMPGVGLLIARSKARVLPVLIEGTPQIDPAFAAIWTPSRSRVRFMAPIDYAAEGLPAADIAADLQQRYEHWTGWAVNTRRTDGVGAPRAAPAPVSAS